MYEFEADLYRLLGDPMRLRILALLRVREACGCEFVELLSISQPAISQHLRKLRQGSLVRERRHKYWTYYALRDDIPPLIAEMIRDLPHAVEDEEWLRVNQVDTSCIAPPRRAAESRAELA